MDKKQKQIIKGNNVFIDFDSLCIKDYQFFNIYLYHLLKDGNKKLLIEETTISKIDKYAIRYNYQNTDYKTFKYYLDGGLVEVIESDFSNIYEQIKAKYQDVSFIISNQKELNELRSVYGKDGVNIVSLRALSSTTVIDQSQREKHIFEEKEPPVYVSKDKLIVNIIIDNSKSVPHYKKQLLFNGLRSLEERIEQSEYKNHIELSVFGMNDKIPSIIKTPNNNINEEQFNNGDFLMLGRLINLSMTNMVSRYQALKKTENQVTLAKPWVIIVNNSESYDTLMNVAKKMRSIIEKRDVVYFPITTTSKRLTTLTPLSTIRPFLKLEDNNIEGFFKRLFDLIEQRVSKQPDEVVVLNKQVVDQLLGN